MFLGVGALRWSNQVFFQVPVLGWKESRVGSSGDCAEECITEPCELVFTDRRSHPGIWSSVWIMG